MYYCTYLIFYAFFYVIKSCIAIHKMSYWTYNISGVIKGMLIMFQAEEGTVDRSGKCQLTNPELMKVT